MFSELDNIEEWVSLELEEQDKLISIITEAIYSEFTYLFTKSYSQKAKLRISTYKHILSGVEMNLIPGGKFQFGFSQEEEQQALKISNSLPFNLETMRPVQEQIVKPFFIGRFPILEQFVLGNIEINNDLFRPEFGDFGNKLPIYLSREELNELCRKFDLDIPTEIQWEYAIRGGTNTLFYFGENLPEYKILEREICLSNFEDESSNLHAANSFGLVGLMIGEWCKDHFRENYQLPPILEEFPPFAIRGGGAALFPWQNSEEWALCASAIRYSSSFLEDGTCGARFMKNFQVK